MIYLHVRASITSILAVWCAANACSAQGLRSTRPLTDSSLAKMQVVQLSDGINHIDLNADGIPDVVVLAWRDNGNAHGFDVFTFYLAHSAHPPIMRAWLAVPLSDSASNENEFYRTTMGADCILSDIRLLRSTKPKDPVQLVTADREFGETYVDSMPVTFTVYRFVTDTEHVPSAPYYFQAVRTVRSHGKYCDVTEAFDQELGLGPYRDIR
jgi:carbapenem resistance CarG-like protein